MSAQSAVFHIGDILSITTGRLLSPTGMDGIYRIVQHMTGEPIWTHQLPRVMRECRPCLLAQFPGLAGVTVEGVTPENHAQRLAEPVALYGELHAVRPMSPGEHESIDPVSELAEFVPADRIVVIGTDGGAE